jgi:hypothetical protein
MRLQALCIFIQFFLILHVSALATNIQPQCVHVAKKVFSLSSDIPDRTEITIDVNGYSGVKASKILKLRFNDENELQGKNVEGHWRTAHYAPRSVISDVLTGFDLTFPTVGQVSRLNEDFEIKCLHHITPVLMTKSTYFDHIGYSICPRDGDSPTVCSSNFQLEKIDLTRFKFSLHSGPKTVGVLSSPAFR